MFSGSRFNKLAFVVGATFLLAPAALAAGPEATARPLRLHEAIESAGRYASTEEARLHLLRSQAKFLETQNKTRVEFRPSLGLLSFTNPMLLAANLGSSLMIGKRGAPTPAALQSAWFDVLTAELAAARARTEAQASAARAFYGLLEKQEASAQAQTLLAVRQSHAAGVNKLLQAARITALDKIAADSQALDAESEAFETETARGAAAMELSMLIGRPELAGGLRVVDEAGALPDQPVIPAATATLFERALQHRPDVQVLRDRIEALRARGGPGRIQKPQSVQVGYGYTAGVPGGVSRSAENFLLGGSSARIDLGFGIALRDIGEKAAMEELMDARARLLECEMAAMERQVRAEVFAARGAIEASERRLASARRKLELASQAEAMIAARVEGGLAGANAQVASREAVHQAQSEYTRAQCLRKAGLLTLIVMCGLETESPSARLQALTQR
jgi:outer membrane protein TolC